MPSGFDELGLIPPLLRALHEKGYDQPTPIQVQAIPPAILGRDVLGQAQTGTGKTAAFALPILQRLWKSSHPPRGPRPVLALVLCPTRELAAQIQAAFADYGKHSGLSSTAVFGGVGYPRQRESLRRGVDVLVATPGRLLDLVRERSASFEHLRTLVLDEADRMLDMGFLPDVERILATLPRRRQTLCFSATMPAPIQKLIDRMLTDPVRVAVAPESPTAERVRQAVFFAEKSRKSSLLAHLMRAPEVTRALVFTRTKHGADRVAHHLTASGVHAGVIHGNKSQGARERALKAFKTNSGSVLVATDIAARGIDVKDVSHVVNYDLPHEPETYVHRIGRTARAEASGTAWSLCSEDERGLLRDIERLIRRRVPVLEAPAGALAREEGAGRPKAPRPFERPGRGARAAGAFRRRRRR
jgi:ATP-dependent RNA helicase RhlE